MGAHAHLNGQLKFMAMVTVFQKVGFPFYSAKLGQMGKVAFLVVLSNFDCHINGQSNCIASFLLLHLPTYCSRTGAYSEPFLDEKTSKGQGVILFSYLLSFLLPHRFICIKLLLDCLNPEHKGSVPCVPGRPHCACVFTDFIYSFKLFRPLFIYHSAQKFPAKLEHRGNKEGALNTLGK